MLPITNQVLFVEVGPAALRSELSYAREKIRKKLNKIAGEEMLKELVFKKLASKLIYSSAIHRTILFVFLFNDKVKESRS